MADISFGRSRAVIVGMALGALLGWGIGATQGDPRAFVLGGMIIGMAVGLALNQQRARRRTTPH